MSNVIGQIVVGLMARTASFEAGMSAGSKIAQKTGKEIERAFEDIGSTAEEILGGISPLAGEWERRWQLLEARLALC